MDAPTRIWVDDERSIGGTVHIFDDLSPEAQRYANEYILASEHDRIVAEKDAEIARLRAALLSGKAFAEDWIAEHGGIDGCDYSDRLAFENMCAALGDTDE